MITDREKQKADLYRNYTLMKPPSWTAKGGYFMNCLCNIFDNNNLIWLLIIVFLLATFCCNGSTNGCGCGCNDYHGGNGCGCGC